MLDETRLQEAKDLLRNYAELYFDVSTRQDEWDCARQTEVDLVITRDIKDRIDEIDKKYDLAYKIIGGYQQHLKDLENQIKELTIEHGETISGEQFDCRFRKGAETWDTVSLANYAQIRPEVACLKNIGKPSASIHQKR